MKKITSVLLAMILVTSILSCITISAKDDTVDNYSADWYAYAGSILWNQGNSDTVVKENLQTYELHADKNADIVGFYGWAALKEGKIKSFGIKLDGGAMIESPLSRIQDAGLDRTAELAKANIVNGEGFWMVFSYTALGTGTHNAAFYAIGEDNSENKLFDYDFLVIEKDPDQWLCDNTSNVVMPGWWMTDTASHNIELKFTTPYSFNGICTYFYTAGAKLDISLLDGNGGELEKLPTYSAAEGVANLALSKAYKAGTYTIKIVPVELTPNNENIAYVVLATSMKLASLPVEVSGAFNTANPADVQQPEGANEAPFMFLIGAPKTAESDPGEQGGETQPTQPTNPGTADASVIAIASLACVALAGVVIAKKIR